jgi:hypothetical protein
MERTRPGTFFARALAVLALILAPIDGAVAQGLDCERLRAAIDSMPSGDSGAAQAAAQLRVDIERLAARADAIGCNNEQFLFFGSPPPPECGGIKHRLAVMQAQYETMRVRGGDIGRRQALIAQSADQCGGEIPGDSPEPQREAGTPRGGGEAVCVRKCDGYYFPLTPAMSSARADQLRDLCQALCPNAEVGLYSRVARSDIANAVSADSGDRYADLPNALKYMKKIESSCACRKPRQSWAEVLGRAEQILTDIDGERPGEGPLTQKQADDRSRANPVSQLAEPVAKPKKPKVKPAPPPLSPLDPPGPF